jgi:CBS-domain-containing membrane protein
LAETRAKDILPRQPLVYVYESDSIVEAFKGLVEKKILSMPVYRKHTEICIGFVDILDILGYIVKRLREAGPQASPYAAMKTWHQLDTFVATPVSSAINASDRNTYATVSMEARLQDVVDIMVQSGAHRVGVLDHKGQVFNILTQTRILEFIRANESLNKDVPFSLGPLDRDTIGQHILPKQVLCVNYDVRTIDAFVTISESRKSALAVLNPGGQIIGNLSASDLKEIGYDMELYDRLFDPIIDFLRKKTMRPAFEEGAQVNPQTGLPRPVVLQQNSSLVEALNIFHRTKVHRIYLVDSYERPVGLVTPADILGLFSRITVEKGF